MANIKNFGIVGVGSDVQFGKGGAKIVQTGGTFAAKDAAGTAFVRFQIANATQGGDAVTLDQLNAAIAEAGADSSALALDIANTNANVATLRSDFEAANTALWANASEQQAAVDGVAADLAAANTALHGRADALQAELDATQSGAGLGTDGTYTADGAANYIATANSLADADSKLDAALKLAADEAAAANATANTANAAAATAQAAADALDLRVDGLEASNTAVHTRLDTLDQDVIDLWANASEQQAAIDAALASAGSDLADEIAARIQGDLDNANAIASTDANVTTLAGRVTTAEGDIDALEGRATALESNVATLQTDLDAAEAAHAALAANAVLKDGTVAFTGDQSMGGNKLTNVAAPVDGTDATNKTYVDNKVAALANAFDYIGTLAGGEDEANAVDLSATLLADNREAGDYYKITTQGWFKYDANAVAAYFNTNDGLVFNTAGGFDKIDNTDSVVSEGAGIEVTGSVDTGFVVAIDGAYTAARQQEVSDEANARAAADALIDSNVATVAANLAQEITDRANAVAVVQGEVDAVETALASTDSNVATLRSDFDAANAALNTEVTNLWANASAQQAAIDALTATVGDDSRLDALEANSVTLFSNVASLEAADVALDGRVDALEAANTAIDARVATLEANASTQQGEIDAVEADLAAANTAIWSELTALDGRADALEAANTAIDARVATLEANASAQQGEIDALESALANLTQDTITSLDGNTTVHAANAQVEMATVGADAKLEVLLSDTEVRLTANTAAANADLRLVATGTGQVIIGDEGAGNIQADDGFDMTVAAGANTGLPTTLHLKGDFVAIEGLGGETVATFASAGTANVAVTTANSTVTFAADGTDANVDLVFDPKGAGVVSVSGAKVVNVATPTNGTDAANKAYVDTAVAAAEVGHVKTVVASVTDTSVELGEVTGTVVRVRVVITGAYNSGAAITVGGLVANELVAATDVDEQTAGVYVIETAKEYVSAETLNVTIAGATAGSAKVYVEYIAA